MTKPKKDPPLPKCCDTDPGATHYAGCPCHEARRDARIAALEFQLGQARSAIAHLVNNSFRENCIDCQRAIDVLRGEK